MCIYGSILTPKMCIYGSIFTEKNDKNVYIWQHFDSKKTQNVYVWHHFDPKNPRFFSPAAGCVINVYIWHHFDPPKKTKLFWRAAGCAKNPVFSQKISACGGPKLATPPLPQNMYNQQKNHVFKSDNKMCPYGIILGRKN